MTQDQSPDGLLARLEAAESGSRELDRAVLDAAKAFAAPHDPCTWGTCPTRSVDDALRLLAHVLPNWVVASLDYWPQRKRSGVCLREVKDFEAMGGFGFGFDETCGNARANSQTPALALCAALLRATGQSPAEKTGGGA